MHLNLNAANLGSEFPKRVGIIFLEKRPLLGKNEKPKKVKGGLNFDQIACAYIILQMNRVQNIFEFHTITLHPKDDDSIEIPPESIDWEYVEDQVANMRSSEI